MKRYAPDAHIIIVGTKTDVAESAIDLNDIIKQANEWGCEFKNVSSKTGNGVNELFENVTGAVF